MDLSLAPAAVAAKMARLADACAAAATRADELTGQISHLRDRLNGRVQRAGDDPVKLGIELDRVLAEQKVLQRQRPIESDIIDRCKSWLAGLPSTTVLEQIIPDVEAGLSLPAVRARIKKLQNEVEALKGVPIPAPNIREKVRAYVERLPIPIIGGIGAGESLTVQWPTGLHALMAFLQPEAMVDRLLADVDQIANTPCPLAEREQRITQGPADDVMTPATVKPSSISDCTVISDCSVAFCAKALIGFVDSNNPIVSTRSYEASVDLPRQWRFRGHSLVRFDADQISPRRTKPYHGLCPLRPKSHRCRSKCDPPLLCQELP
jgi:hypothetical protein